MEATHFFEPSNFTFPFGCHICSVEVDGETGEVKIDKYVAVDDCGNVINPMLVNGQIHGGIAQGLGQAMWEELIYNDDGQRPAGLEYGIVRDGQFDGRNPHGRIANFRFECAILKERHGKPEDRYEAQAGGDAQ